MIARAYLGLGANLGDARATVLRAIGVLAELGSVVARSHLYRTAPWGKLDQPDFVNAVVALETGLEPDELFRECKAIERRLGRVPGERWGPRAIDLDLLLYDARAIDEPGLHVPHPGLRERAFVLVPLAEIDPAFEPLRDALPAEQRARVARMADEA